MLVTNKRRPSKCGITTNLTIKNVQLSIDNKPTYDTLAKCMSYRKIKVYLLTTSQSVQFQNQYNVQYTLDNLNCHNFFFILNTRWSKIYYSIISTKFRSLLLLSTICNFYKLHIHFQA